jgi:hypothetical protein
MKTIFLQYLIMPIVAIIGGWIMMVLSKKNKLLSNFKLIFFVLLCSVILAVPGLSGLIDSTFAPWLYLISQGFYLIMGIIFVQAYEHYIGKDVEKHKVLLHVFVMLVIVILGGYLFSVIYNLLHNDTSGYIGATCILIFFIPTIFYWTYLAFINIPFEIYKVWEYPRNTEEINFDGLDFDRLLVLDIEFSKKPDAEERLRVKAKAPSDITFGDWFRKFIDDYNYKFPASTIEYIRADGDMHSWVFYCKKSFFHRRRLLDPELTITENKIKENIKITSKRVIGHFEETFHKVIDKNK